MAAKRAIDVAREVERRGLSGIASEATAVRLLEASVVKERVEVSSRAEEVLSQSLAVVERARDFVVARAHKLMALRDAISGADFSDEALDPDVSAAPIKYSLS